MADDPRDRAIRHSTLPTVRKEVFETTPARMISDLINSARGATEAAMAPGGAWLPSDVPEITDEVIKNTTGFTGDAARQGLTRAMLSKPTAGQELGIFAGRRAATADQKALQEAIRMQSEGIPREQILRDTGWFKNPSDKWAYEISDDQYKMRPNPSNQGMSLDKAIEHEALLTAYPDMKDVHVGRTMAAGGRSLDRTASSPAGEVHIGMNRSEYLPADLRPESVMMHELQHQIQAREGFVGGESPDRIMRMVMDRMAVEGQNPASRAALGGYTALDNELQRQLRSNLYRRNAGEVEATTVQRRLGYSPEQRRAIPPWKDYPIPEDKIIIPYKDINE